MLDPFKKSKERLLAEVQVQQMLVFLGSEMPDKEYEKVFNTLADLCETYKPTEDAQNTKETPVVSANA